MAPVYWVEASWTDVAWAVAAELPPAGSAVGTWQGTSYVWGPLVAFLGVGVLILVLRWSARPGASVVPKPPRRGPPDDYGALVPVAIPETEAEAVAIVDRLVAAGVRATKARTMSGYRVYVWPQDQARATALLGAG